MAGAQNTVALTPQEKTLAEQALAETGGKISREVLKSWGLGQGEARRLLYDWELRGWSAKDPMRANATYIMPKLVNLLTNLPTQPTPTNWLPTLPTGLPTQPTGFMSGAAD